MGPRLFYPKIQINEILLPEALYDLYMRGKGVAILMWTTATPIPPEPEVQKVFIGIL